MQNQRGFVGVGVLIAIILAVVVLGSGAYYVMQQQAPTQTTSDNFDTVQTLPTTNNQVQQPVNNKPVENVAPTNTASVQLKTYTNAKWGYSIKYPADWKVGAEAPYLVGGNQIVSRVQLEDISDKHHLEIIVRADKPEIDRAKSGNYDTNSPAKEQVTIEGKVQTAYVYPNGHECYDSKPGDDCSFFTIAIPRNNVVYLLQARGDAKQVTSLYRDILSTFTLLAFDETVVGKTLKLFVSPYATLKSGADGKFILDVFLENKTYAAIPAGTKIHVVVNEADSRGYEINNILADTYTDVPTAYSKKTLSIPIDRSKFTTSYTSTPGIAMKFVLVNANNEPIDNQYMQETFSSGFNILPQ